MALYSKVLMRRLVAISAVALLMLSSVSPLLAASCEHGQPMPACHRVQKEKEQKPHCEMMHHHDAADDAAEEPAPASGGPQMHGTASQQNCPMDCCQPSGRTNAIALTATPSLPQLAVARQFPSVVSVVFSSTGFSSHTDRGPPSA